MPITKTQAVAIREELQDAIDAVLTKHGLDKPTIRTTYGDQLRITITASALVLDEAGVNTASAEAVAYERYHASYGLDAGLLGTEVTIRDEKWTFLGLALKRTKYPIMLRNAATGKPMLYTTDVVAHINRAAAAKAVTQ